ncbi:MULTISPECIES: DNA polymerase III subunit gamma/tau [unclassified Microbacterium]|uniref:DNA polymerase III subunit gamma/tau n=1 Tax=unclassified Microbacterium TaxID=2609290 RepID=UPI003868547B
MASRADDDDDALRWEGDDASTPAAPGARAGEPLPSGWHAVGRGSDRVDEADAPPTRRPEAAAPAASGVSADRRESVTDAGTAAEAPTMGNAALVTLGLLGGIYLLYTVGWVIGGLRLLDAAAFLVAAPAVVPAVWLGVLAPGLWFGSTLLLTRHSAPWKRLVALVAGALLLVPWPFIMIGAVS